MASSKVYSGEYCSTMKNKYENMSGNKLNKLNKRDGLFEQEQRNVHLSPLQKLQIKYQQKLMQEKQQKMMSIYEKARDRSLENVYQKSSKEVQKHFPMGVNGHGRTKEKSVLNLRINHNLSQDRMPTKRPNTLPPIHTKYYANQDESPPPNPGQLRDLHRRQKEKRHQTNSAGPQRNAVNVVPLSDYQKFKLDQDVKREERLRKYQLEKMHDRSKFKSSHQDSHSNAQYAGDSSEALLKQSPIPPLPINQHKKPIKNKKVFKQSQQNIEIQKLLDQLERKKQELLIIQKENEIYDDTSDNENLESDSREDLHHQAFRQKPVLVRRDRSSNVSRASSNSAIVNNDRRKTKHSAENYNVPHNYQQPPPQKQRSNSSVVQYEEYNKDHRTSDNEHVLTKSKPKQQMKRNKSPRGSIDDISPPTKNQFYGGNRNKQEVIGGEVISEQPEEVVEMVECHMCSRRFNEQRIQKHYSICRKTHNKERKKFNMTKVRTGGTELETYNKPNVWKQQPSKQVRKANWRDKHNEFIQTIREAKNVQEYIAKGGKASDLPPPVASKNVDYIQCPHCNRRFNQAAAERHIPKCQDIKAKPTFLKKRSRK